MSAATGGLSCSIGIAPNKLLAKLAAKFNAPRGLALLEMDELQAVVWPLPAKRINGIRLRAEEKLRRLGVGVGGLSRETGDVQQTPDLFGFD